jgi:hypothetical protein
LLVLVVASLLAGCGASREARALKQARLARVHARLGLDPPFQLFWAGFEESCMTGIVSIIAAGPESLTVYAENGCGQIIYPPWKVSAAPPARHVWLHQMPHQPGSERLEFGSPAESAVVDLLHLQVQELLSARQESAFVRAEFRSLHPRKGDPDYHHSVWLSSLTPREGFLRDLRIVLEQIESRRQEALRHEGRS